MRLRTSHERRGTIVPMVAICLVALLGFTALAIDVGVMMVARTQCQATADTAAMAGARTLNGDVTSNNNYSNAGPNAIAAATNCQLLTNPVQADWVTTEIGYYTYDRANATFGAILPGEGVTLPANENWSLVRATVNYSNPTFFAKVFGQDTFTTSAVATAVHRPRDICIIMDYSGSMSFDSLLGGTYSGARTVSLNPETVRPQFGHYSVYNPVASSGLIISSGEVLGQSNITVDTDAGPALVRDFYQNVFGGAAVPAFSPALDAYSLVPAGDIPLRANNNASGSAYEDRLSDVLGSSSINAAWEAEGYSAAFLNGGTVKLFSGYTMGPCYWGKTFAIWPPDPRVTQDWRRKFFYKNDNVTPLDDNSLMWTTGGSPVMRVPRNGTESNFAINYAAILRWIQNTGANPFPPALRAGRISYYTAIPDVTNGANDSTLNTRFRVTNPTDLNERFWKHYIDFVLGYQQTATGPVYVVRADRVLYGSDYNWGTRSITVKPVSPDLRYMTYTDNPGHPKARTWFGPMSMLDFMDNYNQGRRWMPGTAHQAPLWGGKIGFRAAMLDIQKNHPNDYASLTFFSTPEYVNNDGGAYNRVRAPLGRDYTRMVNSLFFPKDTIDNPGTYPEINCYDSARMKEVPRAHGGTCPTMSLMHAFNQFSANSSLVTYAPSPAPAGEAGGLGRVGAQKMVILMTDGCANVAANASVNNLGPYQSYYQIRLPGEYPSNSTGSFGSVPNQIYGVANQICALDTANPAGYSTTRKPVLIHSIAYGSLFDPSVAVGASVLRDNALQILQQVQYIGKTQSDAGTMLQDYKIITGSTSQRVDRMQQAFQRIMQDSVSVTLIE